MGQTSMRANIYKAYVAACFKNLQFFGALAVPYFIDWLKVDYTRLFLLQAWFLFWVFILEIPTGVVADKFGRRLSVALGCLLFAGDFLFYGLRASYPWLFVGEFLGAVGLTLMSGAEEALLYDTLVALGEQDRARLYFSRCGAAATLGLMVGFATGTRVAASLPYPHGLAVPFLMTAGSGVLSAAVYLSMKEPPRVKPTEGFLRMGVQGLRTLLTHAELRGYVFNAVTISSVTFFAFWFYQPVMLRAGMPLAHIGLFAAGFNLFAALLLANSERLERLFGIRRLLFLTAITPALLFVVVAASRHLWVLGPAFFLLVGCKVVRGPVLVALINRYIDSANRATVISSMSLLERGITCLIYPLIGRLADVKLGWRGGVEQVGRERGVDLALYMLAALCGVFAVATRLSHVAAEKEAHVG